MKQVIADWFERYFSDPQAVFIFLMILVLVLVFYTVGDMLAPVFASVVIAYLLEGSIAKLVAWRIPRFLALTVVFSIFLMVLFLLLVGGLPLIAKQVSQLVLELPTMLDKVRQAIVNIPADYPRFISQEQLNHFMAGLWEDMRSKLGTMTQSILSFSIASIQSVAMLAVYIVLLPVLVFFLLKDKKIILQWCVKYMPTERRLANTVWGEVNQQLGNYVRGKFLEFLVVGLATYILFAFFDMQYAMLLALLVGLSVIVPYVGFVVVTIPVILVAYFQWGWSADFAALISIYLVIQAIDGYVLVPLLFSEAVNIHPVAIIVAILVFGGLWGVWGVFFAIPLATVINALLKAWPRHPQHKYAKPGDELDQTMHLRREL